MEHESDGDTNCNLCTRYSHQRILIIWWLYRLEDLEIRGRVETIQITALSKSARLLRRVMETWGDLQSLKLPWKILKEWHNRMGQKQLHGYFNWQITGNCYLDILNQNKRNMNESKRYTNTLSDGKKGICRWHWYQCACFTGNGPEKWITQYPGAAEYTDCISAEEQDSSNECPWYGTKPSDGEASLLLELWGKRITPFIVITPRSNLSRSGCTL